MQIGDVVSEFVLPDQFGSQRSLTELVQNGPIALYFYPAAMTKGCTAEACSFRDMASEFADLGAQRVGISRDSVERQKEFADRYHLGFPLLSDVDGKVALMFGTRRNLSFLPTKRWTFIIDVDRKVLDVIKSELRMGYHVNRSLEALQQRSSY